MGAFRYTAVNGRGGTEKGTVTADTPRGARAQVRALGFTPLMVETLTDGPVTGIGKGGDGRYKPSTAKICLITRQIAGLLAAKVTVEEALRLAIRQAGDPPLHRALTAVRADVMAGDRLAEALGKWPNVFSPLYCAVADAGERSGALDIVFPRLADYLEQANDTRQKIILALIYPAVISIVAFGAVIGMLVYVVPQIVEVFRNTEQTLPFATRLLVWLSEMLTANGIVIGVVVGILFGGGVVLIASPRFSKKLSGIVLNAPVMGPLILATEIERMTQTLAMLTENGVTLLPALMAAEKTISTPLLREGVAQARREVAEGKPLHASLEKGGRFPELLIGYIETGEANGRLAEMLGWVARQQSRELAYRVATLTALFEPVLIVTMGGVVLFVALAILMPVFEMSQFAR